MLARIPERVSASGMVGGTETIDKTDFAISAFRPALRGVFQGAFANGVEGVCVLSEDVGAAEVEDDGEPFDDKMARLTAELREQTKQSARLDTLIRDDLEDIGYGGEWPDRWRRELELTPHLLKRMVDRGFNQIDLRQMLNHSGGYRPSAGLFGADFCGSFMVASPVVGVRRGRRSSRDTTVSTSGSRCHPVDCWRK